MAEWVPSPATSGDVADHFGDHTEVGRNARRDGAEDIQSKATLGEWDAGDDTEPPPPRAWLLGNVFARRFISSLLAEGGTGKTAVRYAQYLSLVTGKPLTGEYLFQRCRVERRRVRRRTSRRDCTMGELSEVAVAF